MSLTWRATQKASRRAALFRQAATQFADRGFAAVTMHELGEAVGITGPAIYNYVASKEALLVELLVDASSRLREGGQQIIAQNTDPLSTVGALIRFHIEFATSDPDIIRIQDRELSQLPAEANHRVRQLQRQYVQEWDQVLATLQPDLDAAEREIRLLATFGLLNSTPYSVPEGDAGAAEVLQSMAMAALLVSSMGNRREAHHGGMSRGV